jgi:hypothetical protein
MQTDEVLNALPQHPKSQRSPYDREVPLQMLATANRDQSPPDGAEMEYLEDLGKRLEMIWPERLE